VESKWGSLVGLDGEVLRPTQLSSWHWAGGLCDTAARWPLDVSALGMVVERRFPSDICRASLCRLYRGQRDAVVIVTEVISHMPRAAARGFLEAVAAWFPE
jgi:hypothetical protein